MAVDGGLIDDDHRHLIDLVNSFQGHDERGGPALSQAVDCLNALKFYAETHFTREERLQALVSYPEHRDQQAEHREIMGVLDDLIWRAEHTVTDGDIATIVEHLAQLLRRWLLNHIIAHDLRMKPYAAAMRQHATDLPALKSLRPAPACS